MRKKQVPLPRTVIPTNRDEATECVRSIGETERELRHICDELDMELENIRAKYEDDIGELTLALDTLMNGIVCYANDNREELLAPGSKTVKLLTGTLSWRNDPKAVRLQEEEAVIVERLEKMGLNRFVDAKKTISRSTMIKEEAVAAGVQGVEITQGESFYVRPNETEVEVGITPEGKADVGKPKKKKDQKAKKGKEKVSP